MITHLRIDNRLIHGQVAIVWLKEIGADKIVVCNDETASDSIARMAVEVAARNNPVEVLSVKDTIAYVNNNIDEELFVICKYPSDALKLIQADLEIAQINVGNANPKSDDDIMVTKSIAVNPKDALIYRKIAQLRNGILTSRLTTMNQDEDFIALLDKNGL